MEIANLCFTAEDIDGHSCIQLLKKSEDDTVFPKLGLTTFGKIVKFKNAVEKMLPAHLKRCATPSSMYSTANSKPSMSDLASYGKEMETLYKAK